MPLLKRDYYEILSVSRDADLETIERAFQDLVREWQPHVADGPEAEERLRELAEAYSVLSRREARLLYDRHGYRARTNEAFDETLREVRPRGVVHSDDVETEIELRSFEAEQGTQRLVTFPAIVQCNTCLGRGLDFADGDCEQCLGTGTVEREQRIRLVIPPGVEEGTRLRASGYGNDVATDSVPGDLLVRVRVLPPPSDPRAVRYLALALLLVALVALALYVIR